jgi:GNAT superfamily N-acetyltransferase
MRHGLDSEGYLIGSTISFPLRDKPDIASLVPHLVQDGAYLSELWVDPAQQGLGYGDDLLRDAEETMRAAGWTNMTLRTMAATWLVTLYQRRGYTIVTHLESPLYRRIAGERVQVPCVRAILSKPI